MLLLKQAMKCQAPKSRILFQTDVVQTTSSLLTQHLWAALLFYYILFVKYSLLNVFIECTAVSLLSIAYKKYDHGHRLLSPDVKLQNQCFPSWCVGV